MPTADRSLLQVPELLVRAFIAESFPQIVDFLDFHGRLRKSLQREILSLEDVRQSMLGLKAAVTPRSDLARLSESLGASQYLICKPSPLNLPLLSCSGSSRGRAFRQPRLYSHPELSASRC